MCAKKKRHLNNSALFSLCTAHSFHGEVFVQQHTVELNHDSRNVNGSWKKQKSVIAYHEVLMQWHRTLTEICTHAAPVYRLTIDFSAS